MSLEQEREAYMARFTDKDLARKELAREDEVEKKILSILKEDRDSEWEGEGGGLLLETLFDAVKEKVWLLKPEEFTRALNRLSGDGLFRSKKRIRIDFVSYGELRLFGERRKYNFYVIVTPK